MAEERHPIINMHTNLYAGFGGVLTVDNKLCDHFLLWFFMANQSFTVFKTSETTDCLFAPPILIICVYVSMYIGRVPCRKKNPRLLFHCNFSWQIQMSQFWNHLRHCLSCFNPGNTVYTYIDDIDKQFSVKNLHNGSYRESAGGDQKTLRGISVK